MIYLVGRKVWIKDCKIPELSRKFLIVASQIPDGRKTEFTFRGKEKHLTLSEMEFEDTVEIIYKYRKGDLVEIINSYK